MFFVIKDAGYISPKYYHSNILLKAVYIIKKYPMHATELAIEHYLQQHYKMSLKDICIKLVLNLVVHKNIDGDLVLIFKEPVFDSLARLITYGNSQFNGSKILQLALSD